MLRTFQQAVPIGVRIDRLVQIYRPASAPAALPDASLYWKSTHDNDLPLVLANGVYSFGAPGGVGNFVPAGFSSIDRPSTSPMMKPVFPGVTPIMRYMAYLPILAGYSPKEGDAIIAQDGSRYLVVHPYTQNTAVSGSQLLLERMISQF